MSKPLFHGRTSEPHPREPLLPKTETHGRNSNQSRFTPITAYSCPWKLSTTPDHNRKEKLETKEPLIYAAISRLLRIEEEREKDVRDVCLSTRSLLVSIRRPPSISHFLLWQEGREVVRVVPCSLPRDTAPESQVPMLSGVPLLVARTRNRIPLALGHEGPVCHLSLRLEGAAMSSYMFNMHRASPIVSCSGFYSPRFRPVRLPFPVDFRRFFSFPFSFFNASFYSS